MFEFSNYFDSNTTFYDINKKEQILSFLDTKIKDSSNDQKKMHYLITDNTSDFEPMLKELSKDIPNNLQLEKNHDLDYF